MALDKVLIIEDDPAVKGLLTLIVSRRKSAVTHAHTLNEATAALAGESFDLVILDIHLPDGNGQQFLEQLALLPERPLVVMMTGRGTVESAVSCMRLGAFDYVMKPFTPSQMDVVLNKAESHLQLLHVSQLLSKSSDESDGSLIGKSPAMQRLRQLIERVAPTDATVLVTGESGTGKEMIAREIYRLSPRASQPFIKVNCAAISETLIESEFFGHERGAFTGATDRREGRFELAHMGTLLLDEISEIPANLQAKLLRVLQEREFERVGGNRTIRVNVRLVATSNRNLMSYVEKGDFRQDLYYRLNVFPVVVPPLRERAEDIIILAETFLRRYVRKHGVKVSGFSDTARAAMRAYSWPGNVRELQNTIERAVILSEGGRPVSASALGLPGVNLDSLPPEPVEIFTSVAEAAPSTESAASASSTTAATGGVRSLIELEKQAIFSTLAHTKGNRNEAAELLGISIRTLRNKLNEYAAEGGTAIPEEN